MDQAGLRETEARCTQESMPRCQAACPLQLDVRGFMEQMRTGKTAAARKILERHLPLPGILARICDHPCEEPCLRRDLGGSLAVSALEKVCVSAVGQQTRALPRPPKEGRVAVLGAGLAGWVVAWELSRKGYRVTLFHENAPEAVLLRRFPELTVSVEDKEACATEYAALVKAGTMFEEKILCPALLKACRKEFQGIFIDADAAPALAPELERLDPITLCTPDGLCCGGWPERTPTGTVCVSASRQAGEGRRAASTLERLLTGVSLTAAREKEGTSTTRLHTLLDGIEPHDRSIPEQGYDEIRGTARYTLAEAATEAERCIHCQCLACVKECVYLQKFRGYPRTYARQIFNSATIVLGHRMANPLINGCALCGQCTEICPERFSMSELCLSARQDMVRNGTMPPSAHEFALEDMDSANGPECALYTTGSPERATCTQAFFPGCQLAASRSSQILPVYDMLQACFPSENVGLFLSCCGVPAHWAGQEDRFLETLGSIRRQWENVGKPRLIMACASCLKSFREAAPDIPVVSLWEILDQKANLERGTPQSPPAQGTFPAVLSIHDPCSARHDAAWQQAVRRLARKQGLTLEEPRLTGTQTACCGYGGLVATAQPELTELANAMTAHRAAELPHPALASCIMCRDRLVAAGKPCLHLLDILPGLGNDMGLPRNSMEEKGPGLSARRANRAALRRTVMQKTGQDEGTVDAPSNVRIPPDVLERLESKHILREDVERALMAIERTGDRFLNRANGRFLGSWRPRNVTFWVDYALEDGGYLVADAYCHRMKVPHTGGTNKTDTEISDCCDKSSDHACCGRKA